MQRVTKPIVMGVAAVFGLGLVTAAAADTHGDAVRAAVTKAKALVGEARGDAVSLVASANGKAESAEAAADKTAREAEQDADQSIDKDSHGDMVSMVARNHSLTAAHKNGKKKVNHGGAVSAAAHTGR